jgi:hypothetical protein
MRVWRTGRAYRRKGNGGRTRRVDERKARVWEACTPRENLGYAYETI